MKTSRQSRAYTMYHGGVPTDSHREKRGDMEHNNSQESYKNIKKRVRNKTTERKEGGENGKQQRTETGRQAHTGSYQEPGAETNPRGARLRKESRRAYEAEQGRHKYACDRLRGWAGIVQC
jgi:hypothetical protein